MMGAFTDAQTKQFYRQAYKNLKPGGWIEQIEVSVMFDSDDNTIPANSAMASWGYVWLSNPQYRANTNTAQFSLNAVEKWGTLSTPWIL